VQSGGMADYGAISGFHPLVSGEGGTVD
jgi:hypothetical protein